MSAAHLDGDVVVAHADTRVAMPTDVHRRVGAMLDVTVGTGGATVRLVAAVFKRVRRT